MSALCKEHLSHDLSSFQAYGSETQIDLRGGVPRVTLESGVRSKNIDTKSPVTPKSSHHRGSQVQAGGNVSDTTVPLLQGQSPAGALCPAKQTGLAAIKWLEREQKQQQVQRARPLARSSLVGSLACPPQAQGRICSLSPCRLLSSLVPGAGRAAGEDF